MAPKATTFQLAQSCSEACYGCGCGCEQTEDGKEECKAGAPLSNAPRSSGRHSFVPFKKPGFESDPTTRAPTRAIERDRVMCQIMFCKRLRVSECLCRSIALVFAWNLHRLRIRFALNTDDDFAFVSPAFGSKKTSFYSSETSSSQHHITSPFVSNSDCFGIKNTAFASVVCGKPKTKNRFNYWFISMVAAKERMRLKRKLPMLNIKLIQRLMQRQKKIASAEKDVEKSDAQTVQKYSSHSLAT